MLQYPYGVLDYEASGLEDHTYPIEIGIAIKREKSSRIESWGSLIRPTSEWVEKGFWNPESQEIHNIPRSDLIGAPTIDHVARQAMKFAGDIPLYFDGGRFDLYWHHRLVTAAPHFSLSIHSIHLIINMTEYLRAFADLRVEHRAEADAVQNIEIIENLLSR